MPPLVNIAAIPEHLNHRLAGRCGGGVGLKIFLGLSILFGSWAEIPAAPVAAKAPVSDANSVVAAYLVNFLRYVEWPDDVPLAGEPWRIGLFNAESLHLSLVRMVEGKMVRGHPIKVVLETDPENLLGCQLVMFGDSSPATIAAARKLLSDRPVLTVVYHEKESAPEGMIIELLLRGRKIRYRLNAASLAAHGLKPTPGLLENALPPVASSGANSP